MDFKTNSRNGVLFYAADSRHEDFIAVYMHHGHVYYAFNCGNGAAVISSPYRFNDGVWHTVSIVTICIPMYFYDRVKEFDPIVHIDSKYSMQTNDAN